MRNKPLKQSEHGMALVLTLSVIVLITVIILSFSINTQVEVVSAKGAYNDVSTKLLSDFAINEALAKIKEATPRDRHWAAGPGRIQTWNEQDQKWIKTLLYSGTKGGEFGDVALNVPVLSSSTQYTIISPNSEHPVPDPMVVSWINVLKDGTVSTDAEYSKRLSDTNPVVGRYAYWVDTENSKVNINTAGRVQTKYSVFPKYSAVRGHRYFESEGENDKTDAQNLTAHPSRVDLSRLAATLPDPTSGKIDSVSLEAGLETFRATDSSYWEGDEYETYNSSTNSHVVPVLRTTGMHRFKGITEWSEFGITGITKRLVEANKFNITTVSRAPEVNPWGYNKIWFQYQPAHNSPASTTSPPLRIDEYKSPFPQSPFDFTPDAPNTAMTWYNLNNVDQRYYAYPFYRNSGSPSKNLVYIKGMISSGEVADCIENFMSIFKKKTWPGFPNMSFEDKYGTLECQSLAFNIANLFDSAVSGGVHPPHAYSFTTAYGAYRNSNAKGACVYNNRVFEGTRPGPFVNEIALEFSKTKFGFTLTGDEVGMPGGTPKPEDLDPNDPFNNLEPPEQEGGEDENEGGNDNKAWDGFTKSNRRPGFAPPVNAAMYGTKAKDFFNVQVAPKVELWIPDQVGFFDVLTRGNSGPVFSVQMCDVEVVCSGIHNGKSVKYSSLESDRYIWGIDDDQPPPDKEGKPSPAIGWGVSGLSTIVRGTTGGTHSFLERGRYCVVELPKFYVGPFDKNTKPKLSVRLRINTFSRCRWTNLSSQQRIPIGVIPKNQPDDEDFSKRNRLWFETDSLHLTKDSIPVVVSKEVIDPRVYRYPSDWIDVPNSKFPSHSLNGENYSYKDKKSYIDGAGYVWDDSKLAGPDLRIRSGYVYGSSSELDKVTPLRGDQWASNIVGFPGVGWLSMLQTNATSSLSGSGKPEPWRTLRFSPATEGNKLPDWLFTDLFAVAYTSTYLSHTNGKVNVNAKIEPFGFNRLTPLKALLVPSSFTDGISIGVDQIAEDIANMKGIDSGPCSGLPSDTFVYSGQIAQVPSLTASGDNNFKREALFRDIAGIVTTQCADYKVYGVAQSLDRRGNPTSEKRFSAMISREVDVGPDGVPGTPDDFYGPDGLPNTSDDLSEKMWIPGGGTSSTDSIKKLSYDGTDPLPDGLAGRPFFYYRVWDVNFLEF